MLPSIGSAAPGFALPDQNGVIRRLSDVEGKWLVLYFYPKDDTPGCTTEACSFRDAFLALQADGVEVFGVSTDDRKTHKAFADKYHLPFPLLADTEKTTASAYGVWRRKKMYGREYEGIVRTTFLIDPQGTIVKVYEEVQPDGHAIRILADRAEYR